jgi:hypothetical protein
MKKNTVTTTFCYEIESKDEFFQIEFDCELHPENDGIGSYEFWGSVGYDSGNDYLVLDDMKWDETEFNTTQNEIIKNYLDNNWTVLEELITQELYEDYSNYEYDYED